MCCEVMCAPYLRRTWCECSWSLNSSDCRPCRTQKYTEQPKHFQTIRKMITTSSCQSHINKDTILDSRLFSACWQSVCTSIMLWFSTWALFILSISMSLCMKTFERKNGNQFFHADRTILWGQTNLCDFCVSQCQKNQIFLKFGLQTF